MRTSKLLPTTFTLILLLSLVATATTPTPPSSPLRVRGGGRLRLSTEKTKTESLVKLIVEFEPGTRPASSVMRPGQGTWLDRGMRSGEPSRLEYYAQVNDAQKIIDYLRSPGNYYTFECYNTSKGYMQVTKAYPKMVGID